MEITKKELAKSLMDIQAVLLRPREPFTWASGWHSPIYCDNRKILSFPDLRNRVCSSMAEIINKKYPDADVIAGVATGAIAHGVLVADRLGKPFVYVRPKPKDHGTGSVIEGLLEKGARVAVVEDLISTGKSSLAAVDSLRAAGAQVLGMTAIFTYGFKIAEESFLSSGVDLTVLSDYEALLETAVAIGYVNESDLEILKQWRHSPSTWGI
ncbi:MAG: orotate phosphoribosyltransferase [Bacteroidales bacterium]|jgi:orotate phosphoribosyltransferase|nr:orotate phosphoribosyltransferase [Bacteroidales bacterium]MCI1785194.1 orotate phosphoribosyltransferase [Bacteroidales bacterium]